MEVGRGFFVIKMVDNACIRSENISYKILIWVFLLLKISCESWIMKNMTEESCEQVDSSISGIWWSHAAVQLGFWDCQDFIRLRACWWPNAGSRPRPAPSAPAPDVWNALRKLWKARAGAGHQWMQWAVAGIALPFFNKKERFWKWRTQQDRLSPHDSWPLTLNWGVNLTPSFLHQNLLTTYYAPGP